MNKPVRITLAAGLAFVSLCMLLYGALNVAGAFAPEPDPTASLPLGVVFLGIALILLSAAVVFALQASRREDKEKQVTLKLDLPGEAGLDHLSCQQCGGALDMRHVTLAAGAVIVQCPFCGAVYELKEEPKW